MASKSSSEEGGRSEDSELFGISEMARRTEDRVLARLSVNVYAAVYVCDEVGKTSGSTRENESLSSRVYEKPRIRYSRCEVRICA